MITRNALYSFIESVITESAETEDAPMKSAVSFRSLKGNVDEAAKVVRCDCFSGRFAKSADPRCEETDVDFIVEFFVTPADDSLTAMDAAKDLSFEMAKQFYNRLTDSDGQTLKNLVDRVTGGDEFDTDIANLGGINRGATYIYGKLN